MRKLSEIMVQSGILIYREITRLALFSLVCSAVLIPIGFFFPIPIAFLLLSAVYFPLMAGVLYSCHHYLSKKHGGTRKIFRGAIRFYLPSVLFGLLIGLFVLILVSSWMYYGSKKRHGLLYTRCIPDLFCHHVFCVTTVHITSGHSTGNRIFPCCEPEHQAVFEAYSLYDRGLFSGCLCYGDAGPYRGRVYGFIPGSDGHLSEQGNGKSDPYP
ncbi:hypothetical protein ERICII_00349 [Paenibacillus larvae subsp. larvae DSM 25430]|uniref:Uncharacterized protein n=1 Tax=Paenibacillus larvae subsp. larvae DSM 25430 TaxID=697284 RepID=V9VZV5_9BACL|nr:hypothetical protein ERIC2_c03360 [Paenibacillus larvae subsp. larvae DSM 25430]AVG10803.1 hypothetical protein ERICII_00349 [Paenibacillus larvae subsp. larvae DSM 25430]